jgi:hypothetical protein
LFEKSQRRNRASDQGASPGLFRITLHCGSDGRSTGRILAIGVVSVVDCSALLLIRWLRGLR